MVAVATLGFGPWLSLPGSSVIASPVSSYGAASQGVSSRGQVAAQPQTAAQRRLSAATGCSCREVVVNASNVVRDAEVRTGDVEVINRTLTYIAPSYEDTDVEVDQEAEAISGDAVAGQILAVNGGPGCSRVHVRASNIVEDAEVRTGDAFASNRSVILIDPSIPREDLEIEVDQEAVARSGDAVAGQIIGVQGGGPCGGVILEALNRVRNVELETGLATTENLSRILACKDVGCIDDLRRVLRNVDSVEVCNDEGCEDVPVKEFIAQIEEQAAAPGEPAPAADEEEPAAEEPEVDYGPVRTGPPRPEDVDDDGIWGEYRPWHPRHPDNPRNAETPEPAESPAPTPTPEPTPFG